MNEGIYYLRVSEQVEGPYTIGQIYDLWAARKINSQTPFARFEEMDRWQPLSELTLRISAPKSAASKAPSPEGNAPEPAKPKQISNRVTDDFYPTLPPNTDLRPMPRKQSAGSQPNTLYRAVFSIEFSIGVSLVAGLLAISFFLFFFAASSDVKRIYDDFLATKQGGVLAGIALVLLSGFLAIAREVRKLQTVLKSKPEQKNARRPLDS